MGDVKFVEGPKKREMKYNLLPDPFQERFDELEVDWAEMSHSKLLSEAQKCAEADRKLRVQKDKEDNKQSNKQKREDSLANIPRKDKSRNEKFKKGRDQNPTTNSGRAKACKLCKAAGAPEFVYKTQWASE